MSQFERHFTLTEASGMIPWVRSIFLRAGRIMNAVLAEQQEGAPPAPVNPHGNGNGHGRPSPPESAASTQAENVVDMDRVWEELGTREKVEVVNGLLTAVQDEGIVIQDVHRGLIDFPGWRGDEEILLCYELADGDVIGFWHSLSGGYAGRRPIDDEVSR